MHRIKRERGNIREYIYRVNNFLLPQFMSVRSNFIYIDYDSEYISSHAYSKNPFHCFSEHLNFLALLQPQYQRTTPPGALLALLQPQYQQTTPPDAPLTLLPPQHRRTTPPGAHLLAASAKSGIFHPVVCLTAHESETRAISR